MLETARPDLSNRRLIFIKTKNLKMEIQHKISLVMLLLSVLSLSYSISHAQPVEKPCSFNESSQLDFWVGEWAAEWKDNEGNIQRGTNIITKTFDGCVIEENFSTEDKTFTGRSLSMYNPAKKIWQQTWVDNNGSYMAFTGSMEGDKMILGRTTTNKAGKDVMQRMVFTDISNDSFTWNWESSTDGGNTWNLMWQINYKRK